MGTEPESQSTKEDKRKAPQRRRRPAVVRILGALKRRYRARKNHYNKKATDERMAQWTRNVGCFTFGLVIVGLITAWILFQQVKITSAQLRANMVLDQMQAEHDAAGNVTFTPTWKNAGQTTARDVVSSWAPHFNNLVTLGEGMSNPKVCPSTTIPPNAVIAIVTAGAPMYQFAATVPADEVAQAQSKQAIIILAGRAEYRDDFRAPHYFEWCDIAFPNDVQKDKWSFFTLIRKSE